MVSSVRIRMRWARGFALLGAGFLFLAVSGCGGEGDPCSVSGEVRFDSQPIAQGDLRLDPVDGTLGPGGSAKIVDGKFVIAQAKGMLAGRYLVRITATRATGRKVKNRENLSGNQREIEEVVQFIPARYNFASELTLELVSGENTKSLELQSK